MFAKEPVLLGWKHVCVYMCPWQTWYQLSLTELNQCIQYWKS